MAGGRKKTKSRSPQKPRVPVEAKPPVEPPRRDIRPFVYFGLNQLFVVIYFYVINYVIPHRMMSGQLHMWALPILMQAIALGMATVFVQSPELRRVGWRVALVSSSVLVAITILLIIRVLASAAFLSGVYGAFGKAAAVSALIGVALIVELVALLPLFQIKYLRTRAGRRVYAVA